MNTINYYGWKIYINLFENHNINDYKEKIMNINYNNNYYIRKNNFKHKFDKKYLPLLYDNLNNVYYLALGFVYDEYKHLSFNRIEKRNNNYYIYIANKKYFENRKGNVKVKIFNTFSLKHIFAASFPFKDKNKFILNYDNNNKFIDGIIPYDSNFIINAEILREYKIFNENISFGNEIINNNMFYNKLKIKDIKFNKKVCYGIIQGGFDHRFLYNLGKEINYNVMKI